MHVIRGVNVNAILPQAIDFLYKVGTVEASRNGDVIRTNYPVATVYSRPAERVVFHPWRDCNPFFHFYESLWMLAGRSDVAPLARYVKRMASFSDDGRRFQAAYGARWRRHGSTGRDQITQIIEQLRANPNDRRAVLQIWDASADLGSTSRDVACNVSVTFQTLAGALDMVVFCRSNDIIWGCYGANAVHFSMLMEYVARAIGVSMGTYTQISVNWHAYVDVFVKTREARFEFDEDQTSLYCTGAVKPYPLMRDSSYEQWYYDCCAFVNGTGTTPSLDTMHSISTPFFHEVALPIVMAHDYFKSGHIPAALHVLDNCAATDWRKACKEWLHRRTK